MAGSGLAVTVSVVIPTWNSRATLRIAVQSALAQTIPPLEILVCDDGSTDGSEEVVRAFGDPRVRWIPGSRGGRPAIPRNRGIEVSRGFWIAFLDHDDEWVPEKLEKQLSLAATSGCRAVSSNAWRRLPGGGVEGTLLCNPPPRITFADLLDVNYIVSSSAVVEKSLFHRATGFPEAMEMTGIDDYALWLRLATMTDFACLPVPLLWYNDNPRVTLRRVDPELAVQRARVFSDFLSWSEGGGIHDVFQRKVRRRAARDERSARGGFVWRLLKHLRGPQEPQ